MGHVDADACVLFQNKFEELIKSVVIRCLKSHAEGHTYDFTKVSPGLFGGPWSGCTQPMEFRKEEGIKRRVTLLSVEIIMTLSDLNTYVNKQ